jgi:hypothetical protein
MKYTVVMGSGAMIYMPSFIQIRSGIQQLLGGLQVHTHRHHGGLISIILSFKNKANRIKCFRGQQNKKQTSLKDFRF